MKYMNDYYKDFEQHDKDNMNNENYFYKKNIYSDKNNIDEINNNENTINQIQNFENNYNNVNQNNMIDGNDLSINDKDYINPNYIMGDNNNMNNEIGYPNQKQENNIMMEEA
jgi:hypothetical protein